MTMRHTSLGGKMARHLILELWGCNEKVIDSEDRIRNILKRCTDAFKDMLIDIKTHKFNPQGLSAVAMLDGSFMSIHSWPEMGYVAIDIYTTSRDTDLNRVVIIIKELLMPERIQVLNFEREHNSVSQPVDQLTN